MFSRAQESTGLGEGWTQCTWYEVHTRLAAKCPGLSHTNPITFYRNPIAIAEFGHYTCRCDCDNPKSPPLHAVWIVFILPGDTIQIVPMAYGMGWTNIVSEASIKIEYDEADGDSGGGAGQQSEESSLSDSPLYCGLKGLDSSLGQIRLLVVDPGAFSDPIIARFETVHLLNGRVSENTKFLALSYCWGELSELTEVERSEQVAIMNSISQVAEEVHAWLGEGHRQSNSH
ncbi:hypothetical protein DL769_002189 [Monosporascus sp. CRB-8-3]|nr:hypothetical protein DL769_002189 [Monosporascus sp. CRB-8-3]